MNLRIDYRSLVGTEYNGKSQLLDGMKNNYGILFSLKYLHYNGGRINFIFFSSKKYSIFSVICGGRFENINEKAD